RLDETPDHAHPDTHPSPPVVAPARNAVELFEQVGQRFGRDTRAVVLYRHDDARPDPEVAAGVDAVNAVDPTGDAHPWVLPGVARGILQDVGHRSVQVDRVGPD